MDTPSPVAGGGDRSLGIGQELRNDLGEVDPGLGEVFAEVAAPYPALAEACSRASPTGRG